MMCHEKKQDGAIDKLRRFIKSVTDAQSNELLSIFQRFKKRTDKKAYIEEGEIVFISDLHGGYPFPDKMSALNVFYKAIEHSGFFVRDNVKLVILGDNIDRGPASIEILAAGFWLQDKYPDRVFMLRGNHEHDMLDLKTIPGMGIPGILHADFILDLIKCGLQSDIIEIHSIILGCTLLSAYGQNWIATHSTVGNGESLQDVRNITWGTISEKPKSVHYSNYTLQQCATNVNMILKKLLGDDRDQQQTNLVLIRGHEPAMAAKYPIKKTDNVLIYTIHCMFKDFNDFLLLPTIVRVIAGKPRLEIIFEIINPSSQENLSLSWGIIKEYIHYFNQQECSDTQQELFRKINTAICSWLRDRGYEDYSFQPIFQALNAFDLLNKAIDDLSEINDHLHAQQIIDLVLRHGDYNALKKVITKVNPMILRGNILVRCADERKRSLMQVFFVMVDLCAYLKINEEKIKHQDIIAIAKKDAAKELFAIYYGENADKHQAALDLISTKFALFKPTPYILFTTFFLSEKTDKFYHLCRSLAQYDAEIASDALDIFKKKFPDFFPEQNLEGSQLMLAHS